MHIAERIAARRERSGVIQTQRLEDGIDEFSWTDKGTVVQRVAHQVMLDDAIGLIFRWRVLGHDLIYNTSWMVRDGWFQVPIIVCWRLSLAAWYLWVGLLWAVAVLRGKESIH